MLLVPFLASVPNFANLEVKLKRFFGGCSIFFAVSGGSVIILQLAVHENHRVALSTALFVQQLLLSITMFVFLGIGGHKVSSSLHELLSFHIF
jgi:hypothetical protein